MSVQINFGGIYTKKNNNKEFNRMMERMLG